MTPHPHPTRRGRPPVNTGPCTNCQMAPAVVRGLCKACDSYLRGTGNNRPVALEVELSQKRASKVGKCLCGEYATMKIKTNLGKMDVCQRCYEMEVRQAAGVFEA
jgi:NRPS condensation-like uncharacterized protein